MHEFVVLDDLSQTLKGLTVNSKEQWYVFLSIVVTIILALLSYELLKNAFLTSILLGALGGVVHEIAQSNGKLMFPQRDADGVYLGGLFGLLAGGIAGMILAQGLSPGGLSTSLVSESFLAGLALKGFSEAVAGTNKPTHLPTSGS